MKILSHLGATTMAAPEYLISIDTAQEASRVATEFRAQFPPNYGD